MTTEVDAAAEQSRAPAMFAGNPPPAAPVKPVAPMTPKQAHDLAKKQSAETRALAKKQSEARAAAVKKDAAKDAPDDALGLANLDTAHVKERAALREKHREERAKADPQGAMPVFNGLAVQDAVAALHADLVPLAAEHNFEVGEIHTFGLEFDVLDPVTGMVTSPARAHRRDVGDAGQLMTAEAVVSDIVSARNHQKIAGVTQYSADNVMA
jgi:hypothetical protein